MKIDNRHKRASGNPDHARRDHVPAPTDAEIEQRLNDLVKPAVWAEMQHYQQLGLRNRILNLPVMVALVLTLLWRKVPGVCTLQKMLARERVLWTRPQRVSQSALSERFLDFPAELFEGVLYRVLERLPERQVQRPHTVAEVLRGVQSRFAACYVLDGTTLEALFRKLKALQESPVAPLAGHLIAVCDLVSRLPTKFWFSEDPMTNDKTEGPGVLAWLPTNSLVVFDLGYFSFPFFDDLTDHLAWFVTRLRAKTSFTVQTELLNLPGVRDRIVHLGKYRSNPSRQPVRLIEVNVFGTWYAYLTNVLDSQRLSVLEVVAVYGYRWSIETAFLLVKRLLGLAYLWVGGLNGVQLQVWATWLYYAILMDLCNDVAERLTLPVERISVEMVSRSLYYYAGAVYQGYSGSAVDYFADPANRDLGIVKRSDPRAKQPILLAQVRLALQNKSPACADGTISAMPLPLTNSPSP